MRHLILLLSLFSLCSTSFRATAQRLVEEGNEWNIIPANSIHPTVGSFALRIGPTEIIDGIEYRNVETQVAIRPEEWRATDDYLSETDGRVYHYREGVRSLLYDFTMEVGDTTSDMFSNSFRLVVASVDTIVLGDGLPRRRLEMRRPDETGYTDYWIEGIGSAQDYLLEPELEFYLAELSYTLLCFSSNGNVLFPENPETCFTARAYNPDFASYLEISPNPTKDLVRIIYTGDSRVIIQSDLMTVAGQVLLTFPLEGWNNQVDLAPLPQGMYLLRLTSNEGQSVTYRLVKQ